jgi:Na+-translocating ferredoxin:NAD+ oxidoreductase RnfE subunit
MATAFMFKNSRLRPKTRGFTSDEIRIRLIIMILKSLTTAVFVLMNQMAHNGAI